MTRRSNVLRIWKARRARAAADRAYLAYVVVLILLIYLPSVARATWLGVSSPRAVSLLTSPSMPTAIGAVVVLLWVAALVLGRARGPAVLPPPVAWALATSELRRARSFGKPLTGAALTLAATAAVATATCAASLISHEVISLAEAPPFIIGSAMAGVIAFALWLLGQLSPRATAPLAVVMIVGGVAEAASSSLTPFLPWMWVGMTYSAAAGAAIGPLILLAIAAVLLCATVALLLERARAEDLVAQAVRWNRAVDHSVLLDFNTASSTYQAEPSAARRLRAVRSTRPVWRLFVVRDLVGAVRTPGRLVLGLLGIVGASVVLTIAVAHSIAVVPLGATAGILLFVALGPVTDGIRHAALNASGFSLYGMSDARLLLTHALMPLLVGVGLAACTAFATAALSDADWMRAVTEVISVTLLCLIARINNSLKGPLPIALLVPAPSPIGDPMPIVRLAWAADAVVLSIAAGACAALLDESAAPLLVIATIAFAVLGARWRKRH